MTQGPLGQEDAVNPRSIDSGAPLLIFVECDLPTASGPQGEASNLGGAHERIPVRAEGAGTSQWRFTVDALTLSPAARYRFRFADDLSRPTYEEQLEVETRAQDH